MICHCNAYLFDAFLFIYFLVLYKSHLIVIFCIYIYMHFPKAVPGCLDILTPPKTTFNQYT